MNRHAESQDPLDPLAPLADEFINCYRNGSQPSVEEYARRHPEMADRIRTLFPSLVLMEELVPPANQSAVSTVEENSLRSIGDYRITGELGRGGMGIVYRAVHNSLGRTVAIKVLNGTIRSHRALERFQLEARSAARLHHAHIVPVFDVGRDGDTCFYTMQLISGRGLDQLLREQQKIRSGSLNPVDGEVSQNEKALLSGQSTDNFVDHDSTRSVDASNFQLSDPLSLSNESGSRKTKTVRKQMEASRRIDSTNAAKMTIQAAEALDYAHAQGIVHRDIKPSNLLLDSSGHIWITDFGLAKAFEQSAPAGGEELTGTGDILGTIRYMAPERFRGWSDPRTDVYSLGITLYELLTLQPAFLETDRIELMDKIRSQAPVNPRVIDSNIPRDLETIVLKSIDKEPSRRYQSAGEMARDLNNFLTDSPILARRDSVSDHVRRWCRRNPAIATLSSALFLLALAAWTSTFYLWQRAESLRALSQSNFADASRNLDLALAAVDQFCTKVAEDQRLKQVDLRPLRRDLLESATEFQRQLLVLRPDTETVNVELAKAWHRLGGLSAEIETPRRAAEFFQNAIDHYKKAQSQAPDDRQIQLELVTCLNHLGLNLIESGETEQAFPALEQAENNAKEMLQSAPTWTEARNQLALTYGLRGNGLSMTRRFADATSCFQKEVEQQKILFDSHPDLAIRHSELAVAHLRLGESLFSQGLPQWRRAEEQALIALEIQLRAPDFPGAGIYERRILGKVYRFLGNTAKVSRRLDEAGEFFAKSGELFAQLTSEEPSVLSHATDLAINYFAISSCAFLENDHAACIAALENSIKTLEPVVAVAPENVVATTWYARTLMSLGIEFKDKDPDLAMDFYNRGAIVFEDILVREPENRNAHSFFPDLLIARGKLHVKLQQLETALQDVQRAVELASAENLNEIRLDGSVIIACAGDYVRAVNEAERAVDDLGASGDPHFMTFSWRKAASVYARAAEMAQSDVAFSAEVREQRVSEYSARALEMLRLAIDAGMDAKSLAQAPEFAFLRGQAEFSKLVSQ